MVPDPARRRFQRLDALGLELRHQRVISAPRASASTASGHAIPEAEAMGSHSRSPRPARGREGRRIVPGLDPLAKLELLLAELTALCRSFQVDLSCPAASPVRRRSRDEIDNALRISRRGAKQPESLRTRCVDLEQAAGARLSWGLPADVRPAASGGAPAPRPNASHFATFRRCFDQAAARAVFERVKAEKGNASHVAAPIRGKVLKVNVKRGDEVKAGTVLVVTEAMKMCAPARSCDRAALCPRDIGEDVKARADLADQWTGAGSKTWSGAPSYPRPSSQVSASGARPLTRTWPACTPWRWCAAHYADCRLIPRGSVEPLSRSDFRVADAA